MEIYKVSKKKIKIMVFQGSPRSSNDCAKENSKTTKFMNYAIESLPDYVEVDICDLKNEPNESRIQPCNGCYSTSSLHCHWPCDCFTANDEKEPDFLHDQNVYQRLEQCDGFAVFSPIHWYAPTTNVKALFDRLICANQTLTVDLSNHFNIKKDRESSIKFEQNKKLEKYRENHLEGKYAAFFIHGDGGADDFVDKKVPFTIKPYEELDVQINNPRHCIMPIAMQCRYMGINVPDDLIVGEIIGKGIPYSENNERADSYDKTFKGSANLLLSLVKYIEKN